MKNSKVRIYKANEIASKPLLKKFFRRTKYIDPATGLVFDSEPTYNENKEAYLNAFRAVCSGKCKDMFEAHAIFN